MVVLEKFLYSISYKFPKGYPDMKNEQDILILENEIKKLGIEVSLEETKLTPSEFGDVFGAVPYVQDAFDLNRKDAKEIWSYWAKTFGDADR